MNMVERKKDAIHRQGLGEKKVVGEILSGSIKTTFINTPFKIQERSKMAE